VEKGVEGQSLTAEDRGMEGVGLDAERIEPLRCAPHGRFIVIIKVCRRRAHLDTIKAAGCDGFQAIKDALLVKTAR
jgi:hypothetical protein